MKFLPLAVLVASQQALAVDVSVQYSGQVTSLQYADCRSTSNGSCTSWTFSTITSTDILGTSSISVGQSFSGTFQYESEASRFIELPGGSERLYPTAVRSSSLTLSTFQLPNSLLASDGRSSASVSNGRSGYDALILQDAYSNAEFTVFFGTFNQDSTGTVFSSFALPTQFSQASFNHNSFDLQIVRRADGDTVLLSGSLSAVVASAVPELPAGTLLVSGLLAIGANAARRSRVPA